MLHGDGRRLAVHGDGEERSRLKVASGQSLGLGGIPVGFGDKVLEVGGGVLSGELPSEGMDVAGFASRPDFSTLTIELGELTQTG